MSQPTPTVRAAAERLIGELTASGRPAGEFDASRYFRSSERLAFLNVGAQTVRRLARAVASEHRDDWSVDDAMSLAGVLIAKPQLEVKGAGLEVVVAFRRYLAPRHLTIFKRWLASDLSANWATTDLLSCGLIAPLLITHLELATTVGAWHRHRNMWVRRASAVSLVPLARKGLALDAAYATARALHPDPADLIQKAAGWLLREAGKTDRARLERYLVAQGPGIPRTTLRYAIEHFAPEARGRLLRVTRQPSTAPAKSPSSKVRAFR